MPITLRQTKGSPLTFDELDDNFTTIENQIQSAQLDVEYIDDYGYEYGLNLKTFTPLSNTFPPTTLEGQGFYYRDPLNINSFYEEYAFNVNVPTFGGDGSYLYPAYYKELRNDSLLFSNCTLFELWINDAIEFGATDNVLPYNSNLSIETDSISLSVNSSTTSTNLYLAENAFEVMAQDPLSGNSGLFADIDELSVRSTDLNDQVTYGFETEKLGNFKRSSLFSNNQSQTTVGRVSVIADHTSATQPIRINIMGLKTYIDLAAAQADGLTSGDLFIVGNVLNIVP